ncbi:MAG: hypothetical protein IPJ77_04715 [Planctomycetes bacterium]|nr:hypothetical protein [Planctomycetota bacterium]
MGASFSTSDAHDHPGLKPVRVPIRKESVFEEARNLASELPGWRVESADERALVLVCERSGGFVAPASKVTIRVEGPDGIPSATVNCTSESSGGIFARDKQNVQEFMTPFHRRVC